MTQTDAFTFSSTAGNPLDGRLWLPDGQPRAVVQLVHGMAEHIDRYERLARHLNTQGIAVTGHTHLGHGPQAAILGHFSDQDGWQHLIDDVHRLRQRTQARFPGVPYFILGHSMGSFVTRCYLREHGEGLAGAILCGTGYFGRGKLTAALLAANLVCLLGGAHKPCPLIDRLAFGGSNRPFAPSRTAFDWLSRDDAEVDRYIADPYCGFPFTGSGYRELFRGLWRLTDLKPLQRIPKTLPLLMISGDADPIGGMGKGVERVAQQFREAGLEQVNLKLYPGARHELFNETNRDQVCRDVADFIQRVAAAMG